MSKPLDPSQHHHPADPLLDEAASGAAASANASISASASDRDPEALLDRFEQLTDSEDEDEFIRKYGDINFQYIKPPRDSVWFIRPHALNYFKDGVLFRTKGERTSSKTELFLDLMYVGLISNLAGNACEDPSGAALLEYILLFIPAWMVWSDIKDFTNYYYNEDLSQKVYILWILCLLTLYINSHGELLESTHGAALTIVPYILCRLSLAISLVIYSFFIPEHRPQMRLYSVLITITSCLWIPVIFLNTRGKIGMAIAVIFLENLFYIVAYHPYTKKLMGLRMATALNIEHEVERFATFVTIAIGEFLYKVVASGPLGAGFSPKFARGVFLICIAYILFWIYNNGSTSKKATHALRHSGATAIVWIFIHLPLVAGLVLGADAGGDLIESDFTYVKHHSEIGEEEPNLYALSFFFTGGICVALLSMCVIGLIEVSQDPHDLHILPKFWRVVWRAPIGLAIVFLSFAKLNTTILMGVVVALLAVLLLFESVTSVPRKHKTAAHRLE
ncbi:uncharacterized protein CANTADRAFT_27641 [Suhomyces tanzawaensis NRRL Y-17324]|uniref:Low temperature requirement protein A n=1 Tax=Suhomyces tanzawaensis NRRL Y-17324 TaxID=984487 RepID=A0A1E4SBM9_9ASCO|nr:uncharacterized protein CANTADRAFT_27641 [Suhomyces tanzawaensis NRRL Y-17324]ODV76903.1 hypothetical protein CANTADRAFT_27641 [Suhomyces tanzawaensis NRRL Y-17324]